MKHRCNLWKISLSSLFPNDKKQTSVFWAYHMSEELAKSAALRWAANQHGGTAIDSIEIVRLIA